MLKDRILFNNHYLPEELARDIDAFRRPLTPLTALKKHPGAFCKLEKRMLS